MISVPHFGKIVVVWVVWEPGYCVGMRRAGSWSSGAVLALACLPLISERFPSNAPSAAVRGDGLEFLLSRHSCRYQDPVVI